MGGSDTTFRDLMLIIVLGFLFIIYLIIPHLNPPTKDMDAEPPGNIHVEVRWTDGNHDVDLWVKGPQEPVAVGYSNKHGLLFDLLRDDLGDVPDALGMNYENAYSRGLLPGTYQINLHCYACEAFPIIAKVRVSVKSVDAVSLQEILATEVELHSNGQEITVVRFSLDDKGRLVPDSMDHVFTPLRGITGSMGP